MDGSKRSVEIVLYFGPEVKDLQNPCPYCSHCSYDSRIGRDVKNHTDSRAERIRQ